MIVRHLSDIVKKDSDYRVKYIFVVETKNNLLQFKFVFELLSLFTKECCNNSFQIKKIK